MKKVFGIICLGSFVLLGILPLFANSNSNDNRSAESRNVWTIAPYVLNIKENSAVIGYRLDTLKKNSVEVIIPSLPEKTRRFIPKQGSHFIEVIGLGAASNYAYEVMVNGKKEAQGTIRTAVRSGERFSFVVMGDTRPGENKTTYHYERIVKQVMSKWPSFMLLLGDLVDDGKKIEDWKQFFNVGKNLYNGVPLYPVVGFNDWQSGKGIGDDFFPLGDNKKRYYHFSWGNVHFFALDIYAIRGLQNKKSYDETSEQYKWFAKEMEKDEVKKADYRIVFLHEPVYISRGRDPRQLSEIWAPVFKRYGVDMVFASWHLYERLKIDGIHYIISGGAGAELISMPPLPDTNAIISAQNYHFCLINIEGKKLTLQTVVEDGTVIDSLTMMPNIKK